MQTKEMKIPVEVDHVKYLSCLLPNDFIVDWPFDLFVNSSIQSFIRRGWKTTFHLSHGYLKSLPKESTPEDKNATDISS